MPPSSAAPLLEISRLSYRYADGAVALVDLSLSIEEGERVGVIGPNGAGKSTLLLHLNGLLPERAPRSGEETSVHVEGNPLTREHLPEVRRTVALVFQDPDDQLFHVTVRDDVAFGPLNLKLPREEVLARVKNSLAAVGLEGYEDRSPRKLSYGERKRACIAGVLACQPRLLALDEPTANLDPRARGNLISLLDSLDVAMVIATHDMDLVHALCSRVVVLDGGRVHADGPADEILRDDALLGRHGLERPARLVNPQSADL